MKSPLGVCRFWILSAWLLASVASVHAQETKGRATKPAPSATSAAKPAPDTTSSTAGDEAGDDEFLEFLGTLDSEATDEDWLDYLARTDILKVAKAKKKARTESPPAPDKADK